MSEKRVVLSNGRDIPGLARRAVRRVLRRSSSDATDIKIIEQSGLFDRADYLRRYPDVVASGMDPVQHYILHGASEGRDPRVDFSTAFYLRNNPDVAASGINPFIHFIEHGREEGRACHPEGCDTAGATVLPGRVDASVGMARAGSATRAKADAEIIERSGTFDKAYYLATYPGTVPSGMDPVQHFLKYGVAKDQNPNALFDTRYYLEMNTDVASSGMNPLVHFCRYGFRELRNPSPKFDIAWYWVTYLAEDLDTNPLAHYLAHGLLDGAETRAVGKLSYVDKEGMVAACLRLMGEVGDSNDQALYLRLGATLTRLSHWKEAETAFRVVLAAGWDNAIIHGRLAAVLARQGKWWQAVESWKTATALDASRAKWFFHLGEAQEKMNRFALAADAYRRAIDLEPDHSEWYYLLGYMREKNAQQELATAAYAEAVARDPRDDVKAFGVGVFHQDLGYWSQAADAYARELENKPVSAELHFRLGMAHDRCYRWQDAENAYRVAIALNPDMPRWHYRYGFVLERQERWLDAAEAYAAAAALSSDPMPYWHYRCGYALMEAGEYERACLAFIGTQEKQAPTGQNHGLMQAGMAGSGIRVALNRYLSKFPVEDLIHRALECEATDAQWHYRLGKVHERAGDWAKAATAYADALARNNSHCQEWWYRLGFALFRMGRFAEGCEAFRETCQFRLPYGVDIEAYSRNPIARRNMRYRENLDVLSIQSQTILYESTHGASVGGNPYAIFEYLLDHPDYNGWTHVWVTAAGIPIPSHLHSRTNVIFVEYESDLYLRYLATASHLVNDSTFPSWFSRRPEQTYLNTWHGTPLKTLGKSIHAAEEFLSHRNIQRNLLHATHLISPNQHTSDVLMNDFDVRGICPAKMAETGYPRIDRTLNASPERVAWIREYLGLASDKPVVLYAPTWRGAFGHSELDLERLQGELAKLTDLPCQWIFRGHSFSEDLLHDAELPVAIAPREVDTSDLLAVADILVTDYSSILFDFLPMRRPIFYYCYDLDEYASTRGLYFDIRELPGSVCRDIDALVSGLKQELAGRASGGDTHDASIRRFCPYEDGQATARAVAFFLEGDDSRIVNRYGDDRTSLLFFGGHFAPNGINAAFLNLMTVLQDSGRYQLTVVTEPERIRREPTWLAKFQELPNKVVVLGRSGRMVVNAEQSWVAERFASQREFSSPAMRNIFMGAYRCEFRRCFGDARVDLVVDFDGYNGLWTTLFGLGAPEGTSNVIWLHSDFYEEFLLRYPNLRSQFAVFTNYNVLVSVSRHMAMINREKLAERLGICDEKFRYCNNVINDTSIVARSQEPVDPDLVPWFEHTITFLMVGRLSPEKDQAKSIDAFARVHAVHPETRLLLIGDGPLYLALDQQVKQLGLESAVHLAGERPNPFPALRQCSCFVLSSNHEGQPMVLLEAMTLRKPIVATNIDGNRGVLMGRYGHLVDNSVDGLAQGMLDFLDGKLTTDSFDAAAYRLEALQMFQQVIGDDGSVRAA